MTAPSPLKQEPAASTAVVALATGRYREFVEQWSTSVRTFVPNSQIFVLSDASNGFPPDLIWLPWGHFDWPFSTLFRHAAIYLYRDVLAGFPTILHTDVDLVLARRFSPPTNGLLAVRHPGFNCETLASAPFESNPASNAYIPEHERTQYVAGGVQGGATPDYLEACRKISLWTLEDVQHGVLPIWHDESVWNRYCSLVPPTKLLEFGALAPEGDEAGSAIFIALEKNHARMRGYGFNATLLYYLRSLKSRVRRALSSLR